MLHNSFFLMAPSHIRTTYHLTSVISATTARQKATWHPKWKELMPRCEQKIRCYPSLPLPDSHANTCVSLPDTHCLNRRMNGCLKSRNVTRQLEEGEAQWDEVTSPKLLVQSVIMRGVRVQGVWLQNSILPQCCPAPALPFVVLFSCVCISSTFSNRDCFVWAD